MVVCQHFLRGSCRYGDKCYNEHPRDKPPGFSKPKNAYDVLNRDSPGHGRGYNSDDNGRPAKFGEQIPANKYRLDADTIRNDLTIDRPVYIFSCYGPSKDAPVNLFGGQPREQSPEEWRLSYYQLDAQGKALEARGQEESLRFAAEQQIQAVLNDIPGAIRFVREAENKHPNRIDVVEGRARNEDQAGFGGDSAKQSGDFGRMNAPPNAGNPFGGPRPPSTNRFGQTQQPQFGTPSFGTAAAPSAFPPAAQPTRPPGPFDAGAPQNPFSRMSSNTPAFQPNAGFRPPVTNPFAGGNQDLFPPPRTFPPSTAAATAFGTTKNAQTGANANPFAQPGANPQANPFNTGAGVGGQQNPSGTGTANGGQPNPFGTTAGNGSQSNPFGTAAGNGGQSNPFGRGTSNGGQSTPFGSGASHQPAPTGVAAEGTPRGNDNGALIVAPELNGFSIFDHKIVNNRHVRQFGPLELIDEQPFRIVGNGVAVQRLRGDDKPRELKNLPKEVMTGFLGHQVQIHCEVESKHVVHDPSAATFHYQPYCYDQNGNKVRIWQERPKDWNGKPGTDPPADVYTDKLRSDLHYMMEHHAFKDGVMPEYPLPRADTNFDV